MAPTLERRVERYRDFVNASVSHSELVLIRDALQRNQLTGGRRFVDEIENRLGIRVEFRGVGRPMVEAADE